MSRKNDLFIALVLFIAVICFLLAMPVNSIHAELVDRIAAIVNDDIILQSEFEAIAKIYRKNILHQNSGPLDINDLSEDEKHSVLNQMINDKLILQQVSNFGIHVTDQEIDANIERIKTINKLSSEALLRMIELDGLTYNDFRSKIKDQLLQMRLVNREVKSKVVITDADIKAYYDAHQDVYGGKSKYHLRQILLNFDPKASDDNKQAVLQKIQDIHNRLTSGERFSDLARVYSQASSAKDGGDLGYFEPRLLAPQIRNAITGLSKGEFSDIVATDQGYQILYVEDIDNAQGQALADVSSAIEDKLYAEQMELKFQAWLTDLRGKAHIEIMD